jgi:hypothetical protein
VKTREAGAWRAARLAAAGVGASASAAQEVAQTGEEARGVETNAGAAVRARGLGLRLADTGAGARRALVACEACHGSALAWAWKQVRRWRAAREQTRREREQVMRSWRAETRVSRAQERELERSTVEAARRLGQEQVLERAMAAREEWVRGSRAHERRPQLGWRERLRHELMRRDASELASSEYGS